MGNWRDRLRPASFRGAEFQVEFDQTTVGRRTVQHAYILRDQDYTEDLGKRPRTYRLQAWIIGEDYFAKRDKLLDACEKAGAGTLIHPQWGELTVICSECQVFHSPQTEGQTVRFDLEFRIEGEPRYPSGATDPTSSLRSISDTVEGVFDSFFKTLYEAVGPSFIVDQIAADLSQAYAYMKQTLGPLPQIDAALNLLDTAVFDGLDLAANLGTAFADLGESFTPETLLQLADLDITTWPVIPLTTPSRITQALNRRVTVALFRQLAVVESIRAASLVTPDSYEAAIELRNKIIDQIQTQELAAGDAGDDAVYKALRDLRAEVVTSFTELGATLAKTLLMDPPHNPVPALVWAYDRYDDIDRETEVVARNGMQHPGYGKTDDKLQFLSI